MPPPENTVMTRKAKRSHRSSSHSCHAGNAFTNHRVIPANVIGTDPSRAKALKKTGKKFGDALMYAFDTPVPIPPNAEAVKVPTAISNGSKFVCPSLTAIPPAGIRSKG